MRHVTYLLASMLPLAGFAATSWAACGDTEQDRLVWARERMHPSAAPAQTQLVYQWLTNGTRSCSQSGDLWYYRGLTARRLGNLADAQYAFGKADENGSQAKRIGFDPFAIVRHASGARAGGIHEKWALIVGVGTFEKSDDFLQFSGKDARDLGRFLVESANFKQDNIRVLVDKEATTANVREAFGTIRTRAKADDLVLIYFSSHGHPRELDPTGLSYVLTYDTDTSNQARLYATGMQMVELAELGRWVLARDYVLLLDTCYSGAAQAGVAAAAGLDPLQGLQGSGNRVVISASRADERSYEDPESQHGYFTRFLLDGLRQMGAHRNMTSIFEFLQERVRTEVGRQDGRQQHPEMQSFGQGKDIVLGAPAISSSARPGDCGGRRCTT